jgi:hypothetical protein
MSFKLKGNKKTYLVHSIGSVRIGSKGGQFAIMRTTESESKTIIPRLNKAGMNVVAKTDNINRAIKLKEKWRKNEIPVHE